MRTVTMSRSTVPFVLFVIAAAILIIFLIVTRDSKHVPHRRLHKRTEPVKDTFGWTTKNCKTGMLLLLELCPCVAEIDIDQKGDKAGDEFVDCIYNCLGGGVNATDGEYEDEDEDVEAAADEQDNNNGSEEDEGETPPETNGQKDDEANPEEEGKGEAAEGEGDNKVVEDEESRRDEKLAEEDAAKEDTQTDDKPMAALKESAPSAPAVAQPLTTNTTGK